MFRALLLGLTGYLLAVAVAGATPAPSAGRLGVIISETGSERPFPPHGKFVLSGPAGSDSGSSSITPFHSAPRFRDGQRYTTVDAIDTLRGKKGELTLNLVGTSASASDKIDIEYGTWRVDPLGGTGSYEHWRGSGRWAAVTTAKGQYSLRFEGFVTQ